MSGTFLSLGLDTSRLDAELEATQAQIIAGLLAALRVEGELTMTEAKGLTPVHDGILRASGYVEGPTQTGEAVELLLGFGGAAAGYALYVHEILTAQHPVGQAKYLEQPALQMADRLPARVVAEVERRIA